MSPLQSIPTLRLFLFLLFLAVCSAQPLLAARKEALLIANSSYSHFPGLPNSLSDAAKLREALEKIGFRVRLVSNASKEQMDDAVRDFENQLRNTGAIAFFHYGGHGVQVDGKNYLIPSDAEIPDENRVSTRSLPLEEVMAALGAARPRASIVVVDACRDNPLPTMAGRSIARGLSVVDLKPRNSIVIFSAEAGSIAKDGLFTPILAEELTSPGKTIDQIMKNVRREVYTRSQGQQTPGEYNQLFEELNLWPLEDASAKETSSNEGIQFKEESNELDYYLENMVLVEGGTLPDGSEIYGKKVQTFWMGKTEVTWQEWKRVRTWALDNGYDIANSGAGSANDHPVRNVSWYDAVKWCNAFSEMAGLEPVYRLLWLITYTKGEHVPYVSATANGYRLPTEAEWEWAARGGVKSRGYIYSGSNNINEVAWFAGNSNGAVTDLADSSFDAADETGGTWPVAQKNANELGIYDMSGNLWEWCEDYVGENSNFNRRRRGGSWDYWADCSTIVWRGNDYPMSSTENNIGFRYAKKY